MRTSQQASRLAREKVPLLPRAKEREVRRHQFPSCRHLALFSPIALLIGALGLCTLWSSRPVYRGPSRAAKSSVCLTPGCVLASAEILNSRSPNYADIDPCTDFRSYICGGFDESHDLRADQSEVVSFTVLAERGQTLLRHALETPTKEPKDSSKPQSADQDNMDKLHGAFDACQNESAVASKGLAPLVDLIMKVQDKFDESGDAQTSVPRALAFLMSVGVQPLVQLEIRADDKDPDVNVLYVTSPGAIGLPTKEYYENTEILERYTKMIAEVRERFQKDSNSNGLIKSDVSIAKALVEFESKLAAASPSEEDREDVQKYYNPRTLQNVSSLVPEVDIPALIKSMNPDFDAVKVIVESPSYLADLSDILKTTKKEVLQFYLSWKVIQDFTYGVEAAAVNPLKEFNNVLHGREPDAKPERWRTCLRHVDNGLGWILSRLFVDKAFSEEAKKYGDQIILDIKSEFVRKLDASEWMSKPVRKVAIDKVHNIIQKIGYPTASPDIRNPKELAEYYERVNVTDNYFENLLSMTRNDVVAGWEKATKPVDRNEWGMTASTVNAYYNPAGNEIVFPAGIMQRAMFYPPEIPKHLTYGAFGAVSGHELSHAFDSTGRHFDQNGNYTGWWDSATISSFKTKAQCFIDQYNNYTISGPDGVVHHVNGHLTLGENLADAGGLSAAFNAWKRRDEENPDQTLPGLQEYSKEQVFFLSYGSVWCGKTRAAEMLRRLYSDPHSPNAARISLTVANSAQFRESFGCSVKEATCQLW